MKYSMFKMAAGLSRNGLNLTLTIVIFLLKIGNVLSINEVIDWRCPTDECNCFDTDEVDCSMSGLAKVPKFKAENHTYAVIYLDNNRIKKLRWTDFENLRVSEIQFSWNDMPSGLEVHRLALKSLGGVLEKLVMTHDNLTTLPPKLFKSLQVLRVVDLSANAFAQVPRQLFLGSKSIVDLNLSRNRLATLSPSDFTGLNKKLRRLNLTHNQISFVESKTFNALRNLDSLHLATNRIRDIQPNTLSKLSKLRYLDLSDNSIPAIFPPMFRGLLNLEILDLSSNPLMAIAQRSFSSLKRLIELDLSKTKLAHLKSTMFQGLSNLRSLYLHSNHLRSLDDGVFGRLLGLRKLHLGFNDLETLGPCAFANADEVKMIGLVGNPIRCDCLMKWTALKHSPKVIGRCKSPEVVRQQDISQWQKYIVCSEDFGDTHCRKSNDVVVNQYEKAFWKYFI